MRYFIALLILLIAVSGNAGTIISGRPCAGGVITTRACPDATHASILCEDFQGTADCGDDAANDQVCVNTWVVDDETDSTVDFTTNISGTITGKVSSTTLDISDANATLIPHVYTNHSDVDEAYVQFYFNMIGNMDSNGRIKFVAVGCTTDDCSNATHAWRIQANRTAADKYKFQMTYYNSTGGTSTAIDSAKTDYALNTWYGIRIYWKKNTANVPTWGIQNDVGTDSWTTETPSSGTTHATVQFKALQIGSGNTVGDIDQLQVVNIKVDATDYPPVTSP